MQFNKKGDQLAACSKGILIIFKTLNYEIIKTLELPNNCNNLDYSPDD